jgi:protein TonB
MALFTFAQGNFQIVQQQKAHYPKGDVALQEYFNLNLKYPQEALDKRVYGEVMLSYDVNPDSTVSDVVVLSGVGYGVDEEVARMVKSMKFAPAVSNGVVIRSTMILSINVKAIPRPELEIEKE